MSELFRQGDRLRAASLNKIGVTQQGWMQYALSFPYAEVGPWMLPGSGDRAGKALGFDGAGAPVMLTLSTNFTDMVTATGSLTARSVQDRFASVRNVRDFGAVGNGTIAHGLASTPTFVSVGILGDTVATGVEVQVLSGTNITVRIYNESTGADVTSGTFTVMWHARAAQA